MKILSCVGPMSLARNCAVAVICAIVMLPSFVTAGTGAMPPTPNERATTPAAVHASHAQGAQLANITAGTQQQARGGMQGAHQSSTGAELDDRNFPLPRGWLLALLVLLLLVVWVRIQAANRAHRFSSGSSSPLDEAPQR